MTPRFKYLDQLLLIIKGKSRINKSEVIKIISQTYDIIDKINSIFITILTKDIVNNISRSTLHIAFGIATQKIKGIVKN